MARYYKMLKKQVLEALKRSGDDPESSLVCYYQALGEDWWYSGSSEPITGPYSLEAPPDGEILLAFSEKFVYFAHWCGDSEQIEFVPRNPASLSNRLPLLGRF